MCLVKVNGVRLSLAFRKLCGPPSEWKDKIEKGNE